MLASNRRYDIDWIRVIAIALLLLYHVAIAFQPWGIMIGFIANEKSWESLWVPMTMLNVWRIPLLFFVSGMGIYFAIQNRNWQQLISERASRILLPFVFGFFIIVPVHTYIWQYYNQFVLNYNPNPGHLWFLGNIFIYVVILSPVFFYLKREKDTKLVAWIKKFCGSPLGLLPVIAVFVAEALLVDPNPYEMYAMTWHGFLLGMLAFFFGFCFVLTGSAFWDMILKWRWLFICAAIILFIFRFMQFQMRVPSYQLAIESNCWIISVFAFGYRHL
ncbi:MAG: acyltransferase, partial [Marivirga sp.]|nr:acyltransferase [Marivirga sp.]